MNNVLILAPVAVPGQQRFLNDGTTPVGQLFVNVPNGRDGHVGLTVTGYGKVAETIGQAKQGEFLLITEGELRVYGQDKGYGFEAVARRVMVLSPIVEQPEIFQVQLTGNLGRDVELQYYESGTCKGSNSVALYGGKDKPPYWVNVELWGKQAELMSTYCPKGSTVSIAGRLKIEHWKDKTTGQDKFKPVVVAEKFNPFAGSKKSSNGQQQPQPQAVPQAVTPVYQQQPMAPQPAYTGYEEF